MDSRRLAYLDAMGIDVWQPRRVNEAAETVAEQVRDTTPRITIGAGDGDILCIVASASEAALKLAGDIGGAMRCAPAWSWPASDTEARESLTIAEAVAEKMLTRLLVFGDTLASTVFGADIPVAVSTARVHVVASLDELGRDVEAKRSLWRLMNENGIAAPRGSGR